MRNSILYILMGALFMYLAINSVEDTMWNITTIALASIATLDFGIAIRIIMVHFKNKGDK